MHHGQTLTRRLVTTLLLALTLGARVAAAGSISIQWDPNTEPDLQGYRVYIGTRSGVYDSSVDVGNTTTFVYNGAADGQLYCFAVAAYAGGPDVGSKSTEVCNDTSGNEPPTLQNPGSQTHQMGVALTLQLVGADPESSPVTYSATGLPTGLTLNSNTGFLSGTPTKVGTFNVQATISDGRLSTMQAFTWTIAAGVPGVATPLRPTGTAASNTPTFEWESLATATSYRLWVDDASATDPKIQIDYTPAQAGCATAGAVCQVKPGIALAVGRASWSIRATNASGAGPWSGALDFMVPDTKVPVIAIAEPTANPTFSTASGTLVVSGTASDDLAVTQVTWTNNRGGSGPANMTTNGWAAPNIPLLSGANVLTITARDAAGNVATDVLTVTRTDSGAPTLKITAPTAGATHTTSQTVVNLAGTASDDVAVTAVTWATDRGARGTAAGTANWSVGNLPLSTGANVITVTAVDAAGNQSTATLIVTVADTVAPTVDITGPSALASLSTASETIALGGTAADNVGVTQVTWSNSKGGGGAAAGTTSWSVAGVVLKPGANVITVTARDAVGNVAIDSLTVMLADTIAPAVTITAPTAANTHSTGAASVALAGSASDLFGVTEVRWLNNRGGTGVATGTTGWSVPAVTLQPGVNVITVTARDAAGNIATDSITVAADGQAPVLAITGPTRAGTTFSTTSGTIAVGGAASDDVAVTQVTWTNNRGGSGTAAGTTAWAVRDIPLLGGANILTITAHDAAGNRTNATISVTRDSAKPSIAFVAPAASGPVVTNLTTVTLRGIAADDAGVTKVTWQNSFGGQSVATGTSDWTISSAGLKLGANVFTVTAHDAAGNTTSVSLSITLDRSDPVVAIAAPTAAETLITTDNAIGLRGTVTDDTGVAEVSWTNSQGGGGVATGTAAWSVPRVLLRPGLNVVTISARDKAGNTGVRWLKVRVTDVKAPAVRIVTPSPEYSTAVGAINLQGTALDDFGPARVSWVNDRGGSGVANGDTEWTVAGLALQLGVNVITVTASDPAGNTATQKVRVSFNSFTSGAPTDTAAPVVKIFAPTTAATFATGAATVTIGGTATDAAGVTRVSWTNSQGGGGVAFGTSSWGVPGIPLAPGVNVITVTARDAAGNNGVAVLTVTSTPQTSGLSSN
ncbi:MAG TPA: putative Ig domain-containing protein [Vicinamibacterales bacterium]|nr:putative Ig domain-containing protein [Vicinamibacterales bacterium]